MLKWYRRRKFQISCGASVTHDLWEARRQRFLCFAACRGECSRISSFCFLSFSFSIQQWFSFWISKILFGVGVFFTDSMSEIMCFQERSENFECFESFNFSMNPKSKHLKLKIFSYVFMTPRNHHSNICRTSMKSTEHVYAHFDITISISIRLFRLSMSTGRHFIINWN